MRRIESLTFFRFLAAFIVVMFHYGKSTGLAKFAGAWLTSGQEVVSFFFVLTGFVLMLAHYKRGNERPTDFFMARFARLVPVYLIALTLIVYWVYSPTSNTHGLPAVLLNITFMQAWFPPYPLSLNYPAWAMSVEVFFYLTFPFILWSIKKSNISWKYLGVLALLLYLFTQIVLSNLISSGFYSGFPSVSHDLLYYFPLIHFCSFLLGISGGYLYIKNEEKFNRSGMVPMLVLLMVFFLIFVFLQFPEQLEKVAGVPLAFGASFLALPFLTLILSLAYANNFLTKFFSRSFFVLLGESSYSLYILQLPVNIFFTGHFSPYLTGKLGMSPDTDIYLFLLVLILVSITSVYCIEKPGRKLILYYYHKAVSKRKKTGNA